MSHAIISQQYALLGRIWSFLTDQRTPLVPLDLSNSLDAQLLRHADLFLCGRPDAVLSGHFEQGLPRAPQTAGGRARSGRVLRLLRADLRALRVTGHPTASRLAWAPGSLRPSSKDFSIRAIAARTAAPLHSLGPEKMCFQAGENVARLRLA